MRDPFSERFVSLSVIDWSTRLRLSLIIKHVVGAERLGLPRLDFLRLRVNLKALCTWLYVPPAFWNRSSISVSIRDYVLPLTREKGDARFFFSQ